MPNSSSGAVRELTGFPASLGPERNTVALGENVRPEGTECGLATDVGRRSGLARDSSTSAQRASVFGLIVTNERVPAMGLVARNQDGA